MLFGKEEEEEKEKIELNGNERTRSELRAAPEFISERQLRKDQHYITFGERERERERNHGAGDGGRKLSLERVCCEAHYTIFL